MGNAEEISLPVRDPLQETQGSVHPPRKKAMTNQPASSMWKRSQWWLLVLLNIFFLMAGQTAATLLGRFYYDHGGNSKWMATLVQTAGFPVLILPRFLFRLPPSTATAYHPHIAKITAIYIVLGLIVAGDNWMYSYGLLYVPVSTYSLICATQLAFNAVFSYFLNSQRFPPLILNSVVLLTFSAALLGVDSGSEGGQSGVPKGKYVLGFISTLGASAAYSLILSLMQLSFQKVLKRETFSVVLDMQIWTAVVATCISVVGLFSSGEWNGLNSELQAFTKGRVSYVMTLVWTAVLWQVASVGVVGLIFVVSSLFSNVISTLALPVIPVFAVIFFHDKMSGIKVMALLIALWGSASYLYQQHVDESNAKKAETDQAREVTDGFLS